MIGYRHTLLATTAAHLALGAIRWYECFMGQGLTTGRKAGDDRAAADRMMAIQHPMFFHHYWVRGRLVFEFQPGLVSERLRIKWPPNVWDGAPSVANDA